MITTGPYAALRSILIKIDHRIYKNRHHYGRQLNEALKCHKMAKILRAPTWQKIVTTCSLNLQSQYSIKMWQSGKIIYATMWQKIVTKWQNYTYHNVAKNCRNLQSEFTVCDICDKNVAFLFSSDWLIFCYKWKIKLQFCHLYFVTIWFQFLQSGSWLESSLILWLTSQYPSPASVVTSAAAKTAKFLWLLKSNLK